MKRAISIVTAHGARAHGSAAPHQRGKRRLWGFPSKVALSPRIHHIQILDVCKLTRFGCRHPNSLIQFSALIVKYLTLSIALIHRSENSNINSESNQCYTWSAAIALRRLFMRCAAVARSVCGGQLCGGRTTPSHL